MIPSTAIERRIQAFQTIQDIIDTMKAHAGVAIRRTDELVLNIRRYEEEVLSALGELLVHDPGLSRGTLQGGKRILVAFGSSQGLCGAYNERLADVLSENVAADDAVFVIGRRLQSVIETRKMNYQGHGDFVGSVNGIRPALQKTLSRITDVYGKKEYFRLSFVFTVVSEKKAGIMLEQILPPDVKRARPPQGAQGFIYSHLSPASLLDKVLEELLYISLYRCFVESLRSENWYRLRSMEGASENLRRHISELDSLRNYMRQEEITEEMLEILGSGMFFGK